MRNIRRIVQLALLVLFVYLLLNTRYTDKDVLTQPVDLFFQLDPLAMLVPLMGKRLILTGFYSALALLGLTIFLGRFFCGWVCPLGTTLDGYSRFLDWIHKKRQRFNFVILTNWQYMLLVFLLCGALVGLQLVWVFDPITILFRTLSFSIYPAFNFTSNDLFNRLYYTPLKTISEPLFGYLKPLLAFDQPYYQLSLFFLLIFGLILTLEYFQRRAWCRYLCPLGALWGLFSSFSLLRPKAGGKCNQCAKCQKVCPMGAINEKQQVSQLACSACFNCVAVCPSGAFNYEINSPLRTEKTTPDLKKRGLITAALLGLTAPPFWRIGGKMKMPDEKLLRPPGALAEGEFLKNCIRCGECMRVCLNNALQPTFLEATLAGMFSPRLIPRIGYCEYNCYLCTQVCPTQAIQKLTLGQKQQVKIGLAHFDRNRCLPWAKGRNCLVCEEHCPTPKKAIQFEDVVIMENGQEKILKKPHVDENLCIGCGICENKCILQNESAVIVTSRGQSREA